MIRDATKAELSEAAQYAYRLNSVPSHRCKAFPSEYEGISKQFAKMLDHPHDRLLLWEEGKRLGGVLALLVDPRERYLEAVGGVFAQDNYSVVAKEFFAYIAGNYPGYRLDAAYPEENVQAIGFMQSIGAELVDYDYELRLNASQFQRPSSSQKAMLLACTFHDGFVEFHDTRYPDAYWTGKKLLENLGIFRIHIVPENERVAGAAVTCLRTAEIFFLTVADPKQVAGYGKSLLLSAVEDCFGQGAEEMLAMVERDDINKLRLFEEFGFRKADTCLSFTKIIDGTGK